MRCNSYELLTMNSLLFNMGHCKVKFKFSIHECFQGREGMNYRIWAYLSFIRHKNLTPYKLLSFHLKWGWPYYFKVFKVHVGVALITKSSIRDAHVLRLLCWMNERHNHSTIHDTSLSPFSTRGGYSIVKLNTTCETSLLPLYYMAEIILNFTIFFLHIHNHG